MTQTIEQLQAKVAELEAEVERLSVAHVKACQANADSQAELAAEQLNNKRLREALTTCVCAMQDYQAGIGITEMFDKGERLGRKAIATPISTEALDAYVAAKVKEYGDEARRQMQHATKAVWQRDLAVEALESVPIGYHAKIMGNECVCGRCESNRKIQHALSTIKESEGK